MNLELYDDARLQHAIQTMGQEFEDLKHFDQKTPGFFDRLLSNKPEIFQDLMEAVIYEVAKKGAGVIIGHGGQFLLRDFGCALHVLVYATRFSRVQQVIEQEKVRLQGIVAAVDGVREVRSEVSVRPASLI